ncbi:MAG: hypothetical protein EU535_03135 [Promethearchaeota archaeon]|nr:MAG: hypothetical protein EU535_03135 [Candidatus Lokiarchaeota archaeon]
MMNFFKLLEYIKRKESSLILYSLLDRIPIIIFGKNPDKINDFLIGLSELIDFRKEIVFYTDFISNEEYYSLVQNEDIDYNTQRIQIRCPSDVGLKAINQFENFRSWLIGITIPKQNEKFKNIKNQIRNKIGTYLNILINSDKISVEFEGINPKILDLSLEQDILQKISQDTEKSIIRMKRVLSDRIKLNNIDEDLIQTLLDFNAEKNELKKNIFKKEIQNFYAGSKRAFFILSRLNLLNNLEIKTKIGSKTLLETIDFENVSIERIISFIKHEWGENYINVIENNKKIFIVDKIDSLWG